MLRFVWIFVVAQFAFLFAVSAEPIQKMAPKQAQTASVERVREVLAPHRTEMDMIVLVGDHPKHCETVAAGGAICSWSLTKKNPPWLPLAKALETSDRLNLICEFPANDAPRGENSCSVHPQRSNRGYYQGRLGGSSTTKKRGRTVVLVDRGPKKPAVLAEVEEHFSGANTVFELSTLVGDAPRECRVGDARISCIWSTHSGTYGHGTVAMRIEAPFGKRVRLSCVVPTDGSPREPGSCRAEIGS